MSKFRKYGSKSVADETALNKKLEGITVKNFMGGTSYVVDPIKTLEIVSASFIFGEKQYYRGESPKLDLPANIDSFWPKEDLVYSLNPGETSLDFFTKVIDDALNFDFGKTIELLVKLRNEKNMRLNPSIIFVRALLNENRVKFNAENPGVMREIGKKILIRPDDITNQFDYYMFLNGTKNNLPSLAKRVWSDFLCEVSAYQVNKYKSKDLIDIVRIAETKRIRSSNVAIEELMTTGAVTVQDSEVTWEQLRSAGKTWGEIDSQIRIPHMALLKNLRGIFVEGVSDSVAFKILDQLKSGVAKGRQFAFRYWSAYKALQQENDFLKKTIVMDVVDECIDLAVGNHTKIKGRVACLSDNSGSAWSAFTSEYGTVTVAEIANLSSVITAKQADEGYVYKFGDIVKEFPISKRNSVMKQTQEITNTGYTDVGASTEHGLWLFWKDAIENKRHWDTVFIYSDQQAGTGRLYGDHTIPNEYSIIRSGYKFISLPKLIEQYRKTVNPKVNVFSVQVAGYNNSVIPACFYRGAVLSGWTGKEAEYAAEIIAQWDALEAEGVKKEKITGEAVNA